MNWQSSCLYASCRACIQWKKLSRNNEQYLFIERPKKPLIYHYKSFYANTDMLTQYQDIPTTINHKNRLSKFNLNT